MILFYAIDTVGLGHLSRLLGLAHTIRKLEPDYPILFISEATDARLSEEYPFAFYQVPNRDSLFQSSRWSQYPFQSVTTAWVNILESIMKAYSPDMFVFDTYIWPELHQIAQKLNIRQMLIMRNQKDLQTFFIQNENILREMELIAFPHTKQEIGDLFIPYVPESKIYFAGPLLRRTRSDLDKSLSRDAFGLSSEKFVITITNGGGNGLSSKSDDFIEAALEAIKEAEGFLPDFQVVVIKGPLCKQDIRWIRFEKGELFIREYEPKLLELYSLTDIVIGRGGYNTVAELIEIGVPSICVPAKRELDNQYQRIQSAIYLSDNLHYADFDRKTLTNQIINLANQPKWKYNPQKQNDLIAENKTNLARRILSIIQQQKV